MKECNYSKDKYWLCDDSLARKNDVWLNSGHPCKFSTHHFLSGRTQCTKSILKESEMVKDSVSDTSLYLPIDQQLKHA